MTDGSLAAGGTLQIQMLGTFRVQIGTCCLEDERWRKRKAAALFKVLALSLGHRAHREVLVDRLWPDVPPATALNNLHRAVHDLRHILHPGFAGRPASSYLQLSGGIVTLMGPDGVVTDVEEFRSLVALAQRAGTIESCNAALSVYGGDLLPDDVYEDWAAPPREELRELFQATLHRLARLQEQGGLYDAAVETLQRLIAHDPLAEESHAELMRLYALNGRRADALRHYRALSGLLRSELGDDPGEQTAALYRRTLEEYIALDIASPLSGLGRKGRLPAQISSFVGRENEASVVSELLDSARLVVLTGGPGCGKTRLALEVLSRSQGKYRDGAWMVELAETGRPEDVVSAVAKALEIPLKAGRSPLDTVVHALANRHMVLLFDNCEHVLDASRETIRAILTSCPSCRVLATSRQSLGIAGETDWRVPPMKAPDSDAVADASDLLQFDAVRLFVERARNNVAGFALTADNAPGVARLCRHLDGIPLAIELAASRLRKHSMGQMVERLGDALDLLAQGRKSGPARHATLRATLDWSYALLDSDERAVFRRLSVFTGGWTEEAAEKVCGGRDVRESRFVDVHGNLVDKSLIEIRENGRYTTLEPLRQYGAEKLEHEGEDAEIRSRHAYWCVEFAEAAREQLTGSDQMTALARLDTEHSNLKSGLRWLQDANNIERAMRLASALWRYWRLRGHLTEGRQFLDAMLATPESEPEGQVSRSLRARALNGAGVLAAEQGEYDVAESRFDEALQLSLGLDDEAGIADALNNLGMVRSSVGDAERASELFQQGLVLRERMNDVQAIAVSYRNVGVAEFYAGRYERAQPLLEKSLELAREVGDATGVGFALINLANLALLRRQWDRAGELYSESLGIRWRLGAVLGVISCVQGLVTVAAERDPEMGAWLLGVDESARDRYGSSIPPADMPYYEARIGRIREHLGDETFNRLRIQGRETPLEHAVAVVTAEHSAPFRPWDAASTPAPIETASGYTLTEREWEVAQLIAQGRTNREIAAALHISKRTADTHVTHILRKTNLADREHIMQILNGDKVVLTGRHKLRR